MAQKKYNIQQGESQLVEIEVTKDGDNIDLTDNVADVYCDISIAGKDEPSIKYRINNNSGVNQLTVSTTDTHVVLIPIERADSKILDVGSLVANIIVKTTDATLPDGFGFDEFSNISIGSISKGNLKDIDLS